MNSPQGVCVIQGPGTYSQWHIWAEEMSKTHDQFGCNKCGLFHIWIPKQKLEEVMKSTTHKGTNCQQALITQERVKSECSEETRSDEFMFSHHWEDVNCKLCLLHKPAAQLPLNLPDPNNLLNKRVTPTWKSRSRITHKPMEGTVVKILSKRDSAGKNYVRVKWDTCVYLETIHPNNLKVIEINPVND